MIENKDIREWSSTKKFHALLCDPPYEINFMGKSWDKTGIAYDQGTWAALYTYLYPGSYALVFSSSRTYHRIAIAIEDAGFEIRDMIVWTHAGFPKSLNIKGFGSNLKPTNEPIIVARRPLEGTIKNTFLKYGTGLLNIDLARIPAEPIGVRSVGGFTSTSNIYDNSEKYEVANRDFDTTGGRWPANLILQHAPGCIRTGTKTVEGYVINKFNDGAKPFGDAVGHPYTSSEVCTNQVIEVWECAKDCSVALMNKQYEDAARFYYNSTYDYELYDPFIYSKRAMPKEKDAGLISKNPHTTVKPIMLTTYLAKLLLPLPAFAPRRLLIPFSGVGSEVIGAMKAGWEDIVGIENNTEYCTIAEQRIEYWRSH